MEGIITVAILRSALSMSDFRSVQVGCSRFSPVLPPDWRPLFVVNDEEGQAL
jgi:hypothetical protein